jgi:hypothetical protein
MRRITFHRLAISIASVAGFVAVLGAASVAHAQYYAPPPRYPPPGYYQGPPPFYRGPFVFGGAVGFGFILADDCGDVCGSGFSGELHIGGMVRRRLAMEFDAWTTIHPSANSNYTTNTLFTGALQYWANDIFWLKGGLGVGRTGINASDTNEQLTSASGFAIMGAVGVEIVQYINFAMDLQARAGHTFYQPDEGGDVDDFAFLVGFNWY